MILRRVFFVFNILVCVSYILIRRMILKIDYKLVEFWFKDNVDEKVKIEELVEARIKMMRKKNEELMKR